MIKRLVVASSCVLVSTALASETEPVPRATKVVVKTQVRSGPGRDHYVTETLAVGTQVEIYRRDPGGWLAIRPPKGAFSWVRADDLAVAGESLGRVNGEEVVAWVGTSEAGVNEHKWQIRLNRDEIVEVLGRKEIRVLPQYADEEYCRIAPPAGEYRWIHELDVESPPAKFDDDDHVQLADFQVLVEDKPAEEKPLEPRRDTFVARKQHRSTTRPAEADEQSRVASRSNPARTAVRSTPENFERLAKDLDLQLALAVTRAPSSWSLEDLQPELNGLAKLADTTLQRARAKVLLDRFDEYQALQQRYVGLENPSKPDTDQNSIERSERNTPTNRRPVDPRFDGSGWLLPVHSSKRESPRYALLDKNGNILQFVSPAPGINLHRYLRKEIGVFGQRNQPRLLDKPHLTAHRVVNLERHRR